MIRCKWFKRRLASQAPTPCFWHWAKRSKKGKKLLTLPPQLRIVALHTVTHNTHTTHENKSTIPYGRTECGRYRHLDGASLLGQRRWLCEPTDSPWVQHGCEPIRDTDEHAECVVAASLDAAAAHALQVRPKRLHGFHCR